MLREINENVGKYNEKIDDDCMIYEAYGQWLILSLLETAQHLSPMVTKL